MMLEDLIPLIGFKLFNSMYRYNSMYQYYRVQENRALETPLMTPFQYKVCYSEECIPCRTIFQHIHE